MRGGQRNFEDDDDAVKGLVSHHFNKNKKVTSNILDHSFVGVRFVNEDDEDFNNNLAEDIHIDNLGKGFI